MSRSDLVDISCFVVGETESAYRIDHGGTATAWVPKSLCEYDDKDKIMTMPEWVALEKGII